MNTAALDALLDYAAERGGTVTWRDRGARRGDRRWIVVMERSSSRDASVRLRRAGRGGTLDDAARELCRGLGLATGEMRIYAEA